MIAELIRGPMDGHVFEVPDNQILIVLHSPVMSPAAFIALDERPGLIEYATVETVEHAYLWDRKRLSQAGNRRFVYAGTRARQ